MKINKRQPTHWEPVRAERNRLLEITDRYATFDRLSSEEDKTELANYRQALRDLSEQSPATTRLVWPTPPKFIKELQDE